MSERSAVRGPMRNGVTRLRMITYRASFRIAACLSLAGLVILSAVSPAYASLCGNPAHDYGGEGETQNVHYGVYATLPPQWGENLESARAIINYIGLSGYTDCQYNSTFGSSLCSDQEGYGQGTVGGVLNPWFPATEGYLEEHDLNGYAVVWFYQLEDPQDNWVFYDGATQYSGTQYQVANLIYNSSYGFYYSGYSWMPNPSVYGELGSYAELESIYSYNNIECASAGGEAYFGAYDNGSYDSSTLIEASLDDSTWHDVYGWSNDTIHPYGYNQIDGVDAFGITGGG